MVWFFKNPIHFLNQYYENVAYGPKIHGVKEKSKLSEIVEQSLVGAALWDEVKDRLDIICNEPIRWTTTALMYCSSLAVEPEVLLMDEPASALDPKSTAKIEELIGQLKKNYTIVIVTHNMQQAARVSDYTAFFYEGQLIEMDTTEKIFTKPNKKRTEDYITGRFG